MISNPSRMVAALTAAAALAGLAVGTTAPAMAASPYDITIHAADATRGGSNSLKGRKFDAYRLADYVDGTYVSIGGDKDPKIQEIGKKLDGVAVDTPDDIKPVLNKVLAKTAGVTDVKQLPGWDYARDLNGDQIPADVAGGDPIAWLGGFRQSTAGQSAPGDEQNKGSFGYGWNDSGPQHNGNISPDKAYAGSVREFAANLVNAMRTDKTVQTAMNKVKETKTPVACQAGDTCTIPLTRSGVYLLVDVGAKASGSYTNAYGYQGTWWAGTSQPMIVPTRPDNKDVADIDIKLPGEKFPAYSKSDRDNLGTTGKLGEITIKNVADEEVLPHNIPKQRDETRPDGNDASDNGSDVGDVVPYVVSYRIPDLSDYKAAYDNQDPWIYNYRVIDSTQPGLRILDNGQPNGSITVDLYDSAAKLYDKDGKVLSKDKVLDAAGKTVKPVASIPLTRVDKEPGFAPDKGGSKDGQPGEPDAWYYLTSDGEDHSRLVIGLGKWIVKHYGNVKLNDKSLISDASQLGVKLLYGSQLSIRYQATVTPKILAHKNMTHNENWLDYTDTPHDVDSGSHHETPHVIVRQWTYDIDLHKRSSTANIGLENAVFTVTYKTTGRKVITQTRDGKTVKTIDEDTPDIKTDATKPTAGPGVSQLGKRLLFVPASDVKGDYRLAQPGEKGSTDVTTGKDGLLRLRGLDLGAYTLKEKTAPESYQLLHNSEDVTISAKSLDELTNFTTPDWQTEAKLTISQHNQIVPLVKPMFNLIPPKTPVPGLTITRDPFSNPFAPTQSATWGGTDASGKYYADDKTSWVPADLTLWDQPINVMLAKTGGVVTVTAVAIIGVALVVGGLGMLARRRRDMSL